MTIVKIKMGKIVPLLACRVVYLGVTRKYMIVPASGIKIG
jgi:hypothetical protein